MRIKSSSPPAAAHLAGNRLKCIGRMKIKRKTESVSEHTLKWKYSSRCTRKIESLPLIRQNHREFTGKLAGFAKKNIKKRRANRGNEGEEFKGKGEAAPPLQLAVAGGAHRRRIQRGPKGWGRNIWNINNFSLSLIKIWDVTTRMCKEDKIIS